jgi:hypothetical protein
MVHKPLEGLYNGETAQHAQAVMRAVMDIKGGRKGKKAKRSEAGLGEPEGEDLWSAYLPPAPGLTHNRLPNNMLMRYITDYIQK